MIATLYVAVDAPQLVGELAVCWVEQLPWLAVTTTLVPTGTFTTLLPCTLPALAVTVAPDWAVKPTEYTLLPVQLGVPSTRLGALEQPPP
ncbi:hypothetical protein, partial [Spirosoma oryzae]|uniref:hypothetical protein n=1 Tax=Spirosoma oryzae TaxID=1469603 RepID=UPI0011B231B2